MMSIFESLFSRNSKRLEEGSSETGVTTTTIGQAVTDSEDGMVDVVIDGSVIPAELIGEGYGTTAVPMPCINPCQAGDYVYISLTGNEIVKTPYVIGPIGSGDLMRDDIATAQSTATGAATAAASAAQTASAAGEAAAAADRVAQEADDAISAHEQYFWFDEDGGTGAHITTVEGNPNSGMNLLLTTGGVFQRNGTNIMSAQTPSGFTIYDGNGNVAANVIALFGPVTTIGATDKQQLILDQYAVKMLDNTGSTPVMILHLGKDSANGDNYWSIGTRGSGTIGADSIAIGSDNVASGNEAITLGHGNGAFENGALAIGWNNYLTDSSYAFGNFNYIYAAQGIALGNDLIINSGAASGQVVVGKNNAADNNAAFIVGGGASYSNRSNLFKILTDGSIVGKKGSVPQRTSLWSGNTSSSWSGSTATLQLSESLANYDEVEIFFTTNDSTPIWDSTRVVSPDGKVVSVSTGNIWDAGGGGAVKAMTLSLSGTTVSAYNSGNGNWRGQMQITPSGYSIAGGNYIYLREIVGYKY